MYRNGDLGGGGKTGEMQEGSNARIVFLDATEIAWRSKFFWRSFVVVCLHLNLLREGSERVHTTAVDLKQSEKNG